MDGDRLPSIPDVGPWPVGLDRLIGFVEIGAAEAAGLSFADVFVRAGVCASRNDARRRAGAEGLFVSRWDESIPIRFWQRLPDPDAFLTAWGRLGFGDPDATPAPTGWERFPPGDEPWRRRFVVCRGRRWSMGHLRRVRIVAGDGVRGAPFGAS